MSIEASIALNEDERNYAERKVAEGRYASVEEAVNAAVRRDMDAEAQEQALQEALKAGLASGPPQPFDMQEFLLVQERKKLP